MKKTVALTALILAVATLFTACAKNMGRLNYNYNTKKMVELDSYVIEVDPASDEYKEAYSEKLTSLLVGKFTEGEVEDGDTANIDYVGKKDGVAFEGGTAEGYDLVIGSDSFIDGFEDGLIGAAIGSTVDLNLTFPEDYDSADLAGKAVVFTVKVNYVKRELSELNDENAKLSGFKSADEVDVQCVTYAKECVAWEILCDEAVIESYPEKENEKFVEFYFENLEQMLNSSYGMTLDQYLSYTGATRDDIKAEFEGSEQLTEMAHNYLLAYYVLDKEGVKVNAEMIDSFVEESGISSAAISRDYLEVVAALEEAIVLVGEKAVLK